MNNLWKGIAIAGMWGAIAYIVVNFHSSGVASGGFFAGFFATWAIAAN